MQPSTDREVLLLRNLADAGCGAEVIAHYRKLESAKKRQQQIRLLLQQRRRLLEQLHEVQRKIDSLDFLLVKLEKQLSHPETTP